MKVRSVMTTNSQTIGMDQTVHQAAEVMRAHNVGFLPVDENGNLMGVITDRDLVVECLAKTEGALVGPVKDYMTANPICISPDAEAEEALELMAQEQIRRLCVTENGQLVGVLSLGDLALQPLEPQRLSQALSHISKKTWLFGDQRIHL